MTSNPRIISRFVKCFFALSTKSVPFFIVALTGASCDSYRTSLSLRGSDAQVASDALGDGPADRGDAMGSDSARDVPTDSRADTGAGDTRVDLARDSNPDAADAARDVPQEARPDLSRDLPQDPSRDVAVRDASVDSGRDVQPVDLSPGETAADLPSSATHDSARPFDSGAGSALCVGNMVVCGDRTINTSISVAHCGHCDSPCDPGSICRAGACEPATSHWPDFQHDVQHSGESPDESGAPPLCLAWTRVLSPSTAVSPAAIQDGRVFVTLAARFSTEAPLYALNASDGSDIWRYNFGDVSSVGYPSVSSGSVYLANGKPTSGSAYLWSMDATTGDVQWKAALSAQWEHYWAPIRVGEVVYTNGGGYGGLYGIAAADGSQVFFQSLDQYDEWSPAFFGDYIFTFVAGRFRKHDPASGNVLNMVLVLPSNFYTYSMQTAPVFGSTLLGLPLAYVISPPNLYAIDPSSNEVSWRATGTFSGTPAVAGGTVYGISAGTLQAMDAELGTPLWTFAGDSALSYPPVIAGGTVYVASANNVYALDISTHQQVWMDSVGGWLSLAAHKLLVASKDGTLRAYALSVP